MTYETNYSKVKSLLIVLGALAFTAGCLWAALDPDFMADTERNSRSARRARAMGGFLPYIMWITTFFSAGATVLGLLRLFNNKPIIRFSEDGIYAAQMSDSTIPWSNIHGINRKDIKVGAKSQNLVILHVIDSPDLVFKRISKTKSLPKPGFKSVRFMMNGFKDNPDKIWECLTKALKTYKT